MKSGASGGGAAPGADEPSTLPLERTLLVLFLIGFFTWVAFAVSGYAARHSQITEEWAVGSTRLVEVTLVPEDQSRLACASDLRFGDLHCGYSGNQTAMQPPEPANTLQPLNTVKNELFLAAGAWPDSLQEPPRGVRYSIVCNYHVAGVTRSAALRWAEGGPFAPMNQTATVGRLTDCVIPR